MNEEIEIYGKPDCSDTQASRDHLQELGARYRFINIAADEQARRQVADWNDGRTTTPTIVLRGGAETAQTRILAAPSNTELDATLDELGLLPLEDEGDGSPGV